MKLLLLSNSTNFGDSYLAYPKRVIKTFLGDIRNNIVFIPFASVTFSWTDYTAKVNEALAEIDVSVIGIHTMEDSFKAISEAEAIMVGGGNSFQLLQFLYDYRLVEVIRKKVEDGTPYIGWSAGSNIACPTLKTTNDMPIVEPPTFNALDLVPFQINPHYTEAVIPGHNGEPRDMRLLEFIQTNKDITAIGLPEGMIIQLKNEHYELVGEKPVKIFQYGKEPYFIYSSEELNVVLNTI